MAVRLSSCSIIIYFPKSDATVSDDSKSSSKKRFKLQFEVIIARLAAVALFFSPIWRAVCTAGYIQVGHNV